jgi:hypothetical protein
LWKSVENVTAKLLAESLARTYVDVRQARTLYRRCQRAKAATKGAIGHRGKRFPDERSIADVNVREPVAAMRSIAEANIGADALLLLSTR